MGGEKVDLIVIPLSFGIGLRASTIAVELWQGAGKGCLWRMNTSICFELVSNNRGWGDTY